MTFPLPLGAFYDLLPIATAGLDLPEAVEVSRTAGGRLLRADIADRLWLGSIALGPLTVDEARPVQALLNLLRASSGSFLLADVYREYPQADPDGLILGAATPTVTTIEANRREMTISGLPPGYALKAGDLLGIVTAAPDRHFLHEVAADRSASGAGVATPVELTHPLPPELVTGLNVVLARPAVEATIVPDSIRPGRQRETIVEGISFDWQQVIR